MIQIMTLDGWGEIGRNIIEKKSLYSALILIVFILFVTYFLLNLLVGSILDKL